MDESPPNTRFVVGQRPANRRTADPELLHDEPTPEPVRRRTRGLLQRHALGVPLAERLAPSTRAPAAVPPMSVAAILLGVALLLLAALAGGWWLPLACAAGAAALFGGAWFGMRRARWQAAQSGGGPALIDAGTLAHLDEVLDRVAPELGEAQLHALVALKETVVRLATAARHLGVSENFTTEDRMYLHECVRRYIPDSLLAYLRVPAEHRERAVGADGITASETLSRQIALIQQALDEKEARSVVGATEALLQQQRFLQAKARREG